MPTTLHLLLTALLLPLLIPQALWVWWRTPRLPEAGGPTAGRVAGRGEPLSLLLLGESTAAGVGAATQLQALSGQTATALVRLTGRPVAWRTMGRNGATARTVYYRQLPPLAGRTAEVVVIALGVNDTTRLHSRARWLTDLGQVIEGLRQQLGPVPVVLTGIPPLGRFPALPQPLRYLVGRRAEVLDQAAAQLADSLSEVVHLPVQVRDEQDFAADGYHPGPQGYAAWGQQVAEAIGRFFPTE